VLSAEATQRLAQELRHSGDDSDDNDDAFVSLSLLLLPNNPRSSNRS